MLLQQGKDVIDFNSKDRRQRTGFIWACEYGREGVVKLLLEEGKEVIDYGARDDKGRSGYDFAKKEGKTAIVEMLEEAGLDFAQEKIFWLACKEGRVDDVAKTISEREDIIKSRGAEGFILACSGIATFLYQALLIVTSFVTLFGKVFKRTAFTSLACGDGDIGECLSK